MVGGGNSGVEAAIDVGGIVQHVTVLGFATMLKAVEVLQRKLRSLPNCEIEIDANAQPYIPCVFAAGDLTKVPYKQIGIAIGEGSRSSLNAFDYLIRH